MKKRILMILAVCVAMAQITVAEVSPSWRGLPGTTSQVWQFDFPMTPGATYPYSPDGPAAGGLSPLPGTKLHWLIGSSPQNHWLTDDTGHYGVVPLSGSLDILVDNYDQNPNNIKLIRLQLTWRPQDQTNGEPLFTYFDPLPTQLPVLIDEIPLNLNWRQSTYAWQLDWNPPQERIIIGGTINVDELVIDTWCVPEPTTVCLLGLGALSLIRRKNSRKIK